MAQQYDGAVKINTNIDTAGFDRGSKELEQATARLQKKFEALGRQIEESAAKYQKALISGDMSGIKNIQRDIERVAKTALNFQRQIEDFSETKFKTDEYVRLEKDIEKAKASLDSLYKKQKEMGLENARLEDGTPTINAQDIPAGYKSNIMGYVQSAYELFGNIKLAREELSKLEKQRDELAQSGGIFAGRETAQMGAYTEGLKRANDEFDALSENVKKSTNAAGISQSINDVEKANL